MSLSPRDDPIKFGFISFQAIVRADLEQIRLILSESFVSLFFLLRGHLLKPGIVKQGRT